MATGEERVWVVHNQKAAEASRERTIRVLGKHLQWSEDSGCACPISW